MIRKLSLIALLAFLYFFFGKFSLEMLMGKHIVNVGMFIPEGIALAFSLTFGPFITVGIFIGQFFLALSNDINIYATTFISLVNTLEALLAITIVKHLEIDLRFQTFRSTLYFAGMVILVLQPLSAFFSVSALGVTDSLELNEYFTTLFSWWFGNIMGQLLIAPFLLIMFQEYKNIKLKELLLYVVTTTAGILFVLFYIQITSPLLLLSISIPLLIWIIAQKGISYGLFYTVIIAIASSYSVYEDIGAFALSVDTNGIINYNLFVLAHLSLAFVMEILLQKHKHQEKLLEIRLQEELKKNEEQQLLMEQQNRHTQMGEMISMIAHQWRQPLNNLSLVNQLLVSKYNKGKLNDEMIAYFTKNSKQQITQMSQTIDDFRNFFQSDKEKKTFSLSQIVQNILSMTESVYTHYKIDINLDIQSQTEILGYPNRCSQALLNIINNAKDALVANKIEHKHIDITLKEDSQNVILTICDNAGGIPQDILYKIFDPYFSTKDKKNGTGLGLYMSKTILEDQMDAQIHVFNETDGACFEILFKKVEK
jgi:signal transduction histidine kinase